MSIPSYVLRERLDDWQEFYDEYLDASQDRIRDLESQNKAQAKRIRQLEHENKNLREQITALEQEVFDDGDETAESESAGEDEEQSEIAVQQ